MPESESYQSDFGESPDSENEEAVSVTEPEKEGLESSDSIKETQKEIPSKTLPVADQVQAIYEEHRKNIATQQALDTKSEPEKNSQEKIEKWTGQKRIYTSLSKGLTAENQSTQKQLAEQKDKPDQKTEKQLRIAFKNQYITDQKKEGRVQVATSAVPDAPEDTAEKTKEKVEEREAIAKDLEHMDRENKDLEKMDMTMDAFYAQYFAIMKEDIIARPKQLMILESDLGKSLSTAAEKRGEPDAYDAEKVHQIFLALTQSERVESMAGILYQERLKIALEIDLKLGTDIYGKMQKIINSGLSPDQKLKSIDSLFDQLAHIHTEDKELQIKLDGLKSFNKTQDAANTALEMQLIEEKITVDTKKQDIKNTINAINANFPKMPEAGIKLFSDSVQDGRLGLVSAMLGGTVVAMTGAAMLSTPESAEYGSSAIANDMFGGDLKAMPDGSYKGKVEGETVILARKNGRITAYLQYGETKIPIPVTYPDAVGFDLARSEKIAMEMGSQEIRNRLDVRWAFMDHPEDSQFMDNRQAKKFREILHVVLRNSGADAEGALRKFSLLKENRTVNEKYVDALKRCFDVWAPEGNYEDLFPEIEETDLLKLVALWKHEEGNRVEEAATLRTYTLAEIRSGRGKL